MDYINDVNEYILLKNNVEVLASKCCFPDNLKNKKLPTVYYGKCNKNNCIVKIKLVDSYDEFIPEIKYLVKGINCKNLLNVYSYFHVFYKSSILFCIAIEKILNIDVNFLYENLKDLFIGLDYMHNNLYISHNDIKLTNLGRKNNHIIILDLNLASTFGVKKVKIGTPYSMSINMHINNHVTYYNDLESVIYELAVYKFNIMNKNTFKKSHKKIAEEKMIFIEKMTNNKNHFLSNMCSIVYNRNIKNKLNYRNII